MKRFFIAGKWVVIISLFIGTIALITIVQTASAQNIKEKGQVQLRLNAEKKLVQPQQGKQTVNWQPLQGKMVQPGDVLRYTVTAANNGTGNVKNLTINQPIPQGTVYVLNSATVNANGVKMTYSIDSGRSFVENPTVKVTLGNGKVATQPAPATVYTHVRWSFKSPIAPKGTVKGTYLVQVR